MFDFGALPPEINSARMYSGPGSAPMIATASAWDALAAQLELYAAGYSSTLAELQGQWMGDSSMAMASAVAPYMDWATTTAVQAEQAAGQARAAVVAYETAFAMTVPPPVIAANRTQLAILVATNFFGQNTPAIAANETEYAEMWAQDATAMYGYAASSSAASRLTPFTEPPQTTNTGGESSQAAAVTQLASSPTGQAQVNLSQLMSSLPQQLHTLAVGGAGNASAADPSPGATSIVNAFSVFNTLVTNPAQPFWSTTYSVLSAGQFGTGLNLANMQAAKAAAKAAASTADALTPVAPRGQVLASMGQATPVGRLSVPQTWATSPAASALNEPIPLSGTDFKLAPVQGSTAANELGPMPMVRSASQQTGAPVLRNGRRVFTMPRPAHGG
ncbi:MULTISPECIES: PPE family protein [Mycobacterium]|uniref:PPE family protein n=1 Tax=Mycobacterium TaxID=1763 RepID=UPI0004201A47|nr:MULTISPECIES: PPE family protein [Mycobacterium]ARR80769.1 PPE family protein [Mycobacterium intracellulare subsp. yongonense]ASX02922.1 PPE family protein [Mycobacterium intracellulare subsp. chimaera]ETZ39724.1 PPE family protein [Mycobacterium intracellulare MIN_061107_1834]KEF98775.1 hypothetical protein K883_01779 [Mycobacterium sp. TKK-01-0059]MCA2276343.1 PPE family protein [Mycobacterium intracellulare]